MKNNTKRKNSGTQNNFVKSLNRLLQGSDVSKNKKYKTKSHTKNERDGGGNFLIGEDIDYTPLRQSNIDSGYFSKTESEKRLVTKNKLHVTKGFHMGSGSTCTVNEGICKIRKNTNNEKVIIRSLKKNIILNPVILYNAANNMPVTKDGTASYPYSYISSYNRGLLKSKYNNFVNSDFIKDFKEIKKKIRNQQDVDLKPLLTLFEIIYPDVFKDKEADMRMAIELYKMDIGPALYMCGVLFDTEKIVVKPGFFGESYSVITANLFDISERVKKFTRPTGFVIETAYMLDILGEQFCNTDVKPGNLGIREMPGELDTVLLIDPGTGFNIPDEAIRHVLSWGSNISDFRTKIMKYSYYLLLYLGYQDFTAGLQLGAIMIHTTFKPMIISLCLEPHSKILLMINHYQWTNDTDIQKLYKLKAITPEDVLTEARNRNIEPGMNDQSLFRYLLRASF